MLRLLAGLFSLLSVLLVWKALPRARGYLPSSRRRGSDETNEKLLKTLDEFNKLYHLAPCGYHSLDRDGKIVAMNATELDWLGYTSEEVVETMTFQELITADSAARFEHVFSTLIRTGSVSEIEFEMMRKDGTTFPVLFAATAIRDTNNQFTNCRCTVFDITTRKKVEESLLENQETTRSIVESSNDAYVAIDQNNRIADWNKQAEKIFGWTRTEAIGSPFNETIVPEQHREVLERGMQRFLISGESPLVNQRIELTALHKDGSEFPIELSIFPITVAHKVRFCAFIHDIVDRKKAEEAIRVARDQALDASKFKSEFLANMSHEIRTPMNGILGMTEMLLRSRLNEKQTGYATTINEAARSLLSVINDILDFSKIEAGKLTVEIAEFEPVKVVESVAELLAQQAKKKKLSLTTFVDPQIPAILHGDPGRIRQVLMNFAGNAIKFSERGEVCIRATIQSESEAAVTVTFSVSDTGIGMTEEEIAKLFQPFVQVDGSITRRYGGTGLGLSISKRLAELLGGEIGVESVKGEGSRFWISVPLERATTATPQRMPTSADIKQMRVLVVDDEETSRDILHQYVLSWGMRNGRARNADEALEILRGAPEDDPYSMALIDLFMTGTNGLQLGKIIREDERLKNMKLILVTAFDNPGAGEEAIAHGFDGYLTKPIKQSQLLDCITTVVRESTPGKLAWESAHAPASHYDETAHVPPRTEAILVVEDHYINQEVAQLLLRDLGFEAEIAENGRVALELLQNAQYALIFMDCQMPELDGYATTNAIRKTETRTGKHTPIVAMTAHAIEGSREECLAAGMDDYISKPIDPDQLRGIIEKWLPDQPIAAVAQDSSEEPTNGDAGISPADLNTESFAPPSEEDDDSEPSTGMIPPIDLEALKTRYGAKHDRLVQAFLRDAPQQISDICQYAAQEESAAVLKAAHSLKGISGTVFALPLRQLCIAIETCARDKNWSYLQELTAELGRQFLELKKYMEVNRPS